jgi:hypothetical protein
MKFIPTKQKYHAIDHDIVICITIHKRAIQSKKKKKKKKRKKF